MFANTFIGVVCLFARGSFFSLLVPDRSNCFHLKKIYRMNERAPFEAVAASCTVLSAYLMISLFNLSLYEVTETVSRIYEKIFYFIDVLSYLSFQGSKTQENMITNFVSERDKAFDKNTVILKN